MKYRRITAALSLLLIAFTAASCAMGPAVSGSFDRSLTVNGPIRLELSNASGDVSITGSTDGKVHIRGDVRSSGMGVDSPQKRLDDLLANPPIEQKMDVVRIGRDLAHARNVTISYTIEVPLQTEVSTTLASGAQSIERVRGPVKAEAASGSIHVSHVDRQVQVTTMSGAINISEIGDDVRVSTASGAVSTVDIKGDVRINALSGVIQVTKTAGRVEVDDASGSVDVQGATGDVKAHAASGQIKVQGDPGASGYWDLRTVSGLVRIGVPPTANFHLSADAVSGEIRTDIPIMIEEQGKHSLRARVGNGGARIEVHTVSGEIRISAS